jgi:predicted transcriptional regulator of viral defense system
VKLPSRIREAKADIAKAFDALPKRVLDSAEVRQVIKDNRRLWGLGSQSADAFIAAMLKSSLLKQVRLQFPHRRKTRYTWRDVGLFDLLQSLDPHIYFSHYTAIHLHGLTEQVPKTVYLNVEQKLSGGGGTLTQAAIDRAFQGACRVSKNFIEYLGHRIYILNGQNTGRLGVVEIESPDSKQKLHVTDIERTLIDATVRPIYSGGVNEVAKAFELAKDHVSVNRLVAYLRKIDFTYPYHQAIGYYLDRAGFRASQIALVEAFPREFDFYLTYGMKEKDYVEKWKLFVPKGF